jgi:hypothetical protein
VHPILKVEAPVGLLGALKRAEVVPGAPSAFQTVLQEDSFYPARKTLAACCELCIFPL